MHLQLELENFSMGPRGWFEVKKLAEYWWHAKEIWFMIWTNESICHNFFAESYKNVMGSQYKVILAD